MRSVAIPLFFFLCTIILIYLNLLAFMRLFPIWLTLPLLFISLYITLFSIMNRHIPRRFRHRG